MAEQNETKTATECNDNNTVEHCKIKQKKQKDPSLDLPSEISVSEYQDLLHQIQDSGDFSVEDCQAELLEGARYNDIDVVRAILKSHPSLYQFQDTKSGNTALHMAAANGHIDIVELILYAERFHMQQFPEESNSAETSLSLIQNHAGNTALHWAAANGKEDVVSVLVQQPGVNVLTRNKAGRSILTEGFSSQNTMLVKHLLEHDSAAEEKLMESTGQAAEQAKKDSITHPLTFGRFNDKPISVKVRELAIAQTDSDTILGQASPDQDTTGLGIWASSLVCAQWMADLAPQFKGKTVLELGAGCGVPGITLAASGHASKVFLTDFNPKTVNNLQHNLQINNFADDKSATTDVFVTAMNMNWQDPSTWPSESIDVVIGSDLIYQSDMVPLLVQTIENLLKSKSGTRFLYVAPETTGRQGHDEFIKSMKNKFDLKEQALAPEKYSANPLQNQDDEECFLHFNELGSTKFTLYEFQSKGSKK